MQKKKLIVKIIIIIVLLGVLILCGFFVNWNIDINPPLLTLKTNKLVKSYLPEDFEKTKDTRIKSDCSSIWKGLYNCKNISRAIEWKDWKYISYNISFSVEDNDDIQIDFYYWPRISIIELRVNLEDKEEVYKLTKDYIKNYLIERWISVSDDLNSITDLTIRVPKNYMKNLDISELSSLKNLKRLAIGGLYESIEISPWVRRESVWRDWYLNIIWLEKLSQITFLDMNNFPLDTLDWNKLPPNLTEFHYWAMWLKNLENECELTKIKRNYISFNNFGKDAIFYERYENCKNK